MLFQLWAWASDRFFLGWGPIVEFSRDDQVIQGWPGIFFQGGNTDEFSFYQIQNKRKTFSTKKLIAKYQISKSRV